MGFASAIHLIQEKIHRMTFVLKELEALEGEPDAIEAKSEAMDKVTDAPQPAKPGRIKKRLGPATKPAKKRQEILDYLQAHPSSTTKEIAAALKFNPSAVRFHMTACRKGKLVDSIGHTSHARWSLIKSSPRESPKAKEPSSDQSEEKRFSCDKCGKKFAYPGGLNAHLQNNHFEGEK